MKKFIKNIKKYFKYAIRTSKAELKSEVAGSHLNWLWWVIEPLCFMFIYTFVFTVVFKSMEEYFAVFVFIGLSVWEFFNRMITGSVKLIDTNRNIVTKVYIPKYILVLSKSLTYLFKLSISIIISIILMYILKVPFELNIFFAIPIFIIFYIFTFSLSCIIMHFGVYIEDLKNVTKIALRLIFYVSGIFYDISVRLSGKLENIMLNYNPISFFLSEIRNVMIYNQYPNFINIGIWFTISIILLICSIHLIHKYENNYVKVI